MNKCMSTVSLLALAGTLSGCHSNTHSTNAVVSDLTPNMNGLAETRSQNDAGIALVNNENERMYIDDWRRLMLLDKSSSLTPYPITGN